MNVLFRIELFSVTWAFTHMTIVCCMFVATIIVSIGHPWVAARAKPHIDVFVLFVRGSIGCTGSDRWNGCVFMVSPMHYAASSPVLKISHVLGFVNYRS